MKPDGPDVERTAADAVWDPSHPLSRVFAEAPIGMALISVERGHEGERLAVNRSLCEMTGYEESELLTLRLGELGHPDDARVGTEERARLLSGELESFEIERRCCRKDQRVVVLRSNVALVRDADGAPLYAIAQVRDETAERAAESRLRASEERFRRLAESNDDAIYLMRLGPARRYEYVSPAIEKLSGRTPAEFYEDPDLLWRIVHPDDRPLLEAVKAPFGRPVVTRWIRRDGSILWAEQRVVPITEDGQITAIQGIVRDVTETLKRREELAFHARLLDELDAGVVATDHEGNVTLWNGSAERMYGWKKDEVLGRPGTSIPELKVPDETLAEIAAATADGGTWEGEVEGRHKDGRHFPTQMRIRPLMRADGSVEGRLAIAWDISETKYATSQLRRQAAQQAAVAELGERAIEGLPPQELMEHAVKMLRETLAVEHAAALEHEPAAARLTMRASDGFGGMEHSVPTESDNLSALALRKGGPLRVDDAQADFETRTSGAWVGLMSGVSVPIRGKGRPFGVLSAFSSRTRAFGSDDMNFVTSTANILADAIERHRVEEQLAHQGAARPAHRPAQPRPVQRPPAPRARRRPARREPRRRDLLRPRQLQARQRRLGHERRRRAAAARRAAPAGGAAAVRHGRPLRRRRVRDPLRGRRRGRPAMIAERVARGARRAGPPRRRRPTTSRQHRHRAWPTRAPPTPTRCMRDADAAMYRAKERGGDRFEVFDERHARRRPSAGCASSPSCAARSSATRSSCTTSRSSRSTATARRSASRRSSAGSTRSAGSSRRASSSRSPRRPA